MSFIVNEKVSQERDMTLEIALPQAKCGEVPKYSHSYACDTTLIEAFEVRRGGGATQPPTYA